MAINLHEKYASQIQTVFSQKSLVAGHLTEEYDFSGAKTVKVTTPLTVPMTNYNRTAAQNRYGAPVEMQDLVQELTLTQDRSFSLVIDKGNNADQGGVKAAGRMLALQVAERAIPELDTYCLYKLAREAGTIYGDGDGITPANICERITRGTESLDDAEVPPDGRTLFVPANVYRALRLSDEFAKVESIAADALKKGVVGLFDNMQVVKVPKSRWPEHVNFIIVHKNAATAPVKLNDTRLHQDPPGISGNLLEGRQYYDLFVFAAKANGVYADICTADGGAVLCETPTIETKSTNKGAFSSATLGATFFYTTDGSDPRYSPTAKTGSAAEDTSAGTLVKVFCVKDGAFRSAVAQHLF